MIKYEQIEYIILDVDGTLTDSGIYYDDQGNELKRFSTRDGEAVKLARSLGMKIVVITGRKCMATDRRIKELKIDFCEQGIQNKYDYIQNFMNHHNIKKNQLGYIGDDINDLKAMSLAGFIGCPSDGCSEVKAIADYVSQVNGGAGAVRDVIEYILRKRGEWNKALKNVYDIDIASKD